MVLKRPRPWIDGFNERQRKEIEFCRLYARQFAHGTTGHNAMMVVANMAALLDTMQDVELFIDRDNDIVFSIRCENDVSKKQWKEYLARLTSDTGRLSGVLPDEKE